MARTGKVARVANFNGACCFCYVVFVFSIGAWVTKVAKTDTAARATSFSRVMFLL